MRINQSKERTLYRGVLRTAWEIAWARRDLWILGLAASFLMLNGGAFEIFARAVYKIQSGAPYAGYLDFAQAAASAIANGDPVARVSLFFSLVLGACGAAIVAIAAVAASGGIIYATYRGLNRRKAGSGESFGVGLRKLGPLIATQLVGRLVMFVLFVLAALGVYVWSGTDLAWAVSAGLLAVFAASTLFIVFLMMMSSAAVVVDGEGWIHAAHSAWNILKRHWLISIEMIGLVFLFAAAAVLAVGIGSVILLIPFTLILLAVSVLNSAAALSAVAFVFQMLILALILTVGSFLAVFEHSAWTLLYAELRERGAIAKLERLWHALKSIRNVRRRRFAKS